MGLKILLRRIELLRIIALPASVSKGTGFGALEWLRAWEVRPAAKSCARGVGVGDES